MQRGEKGAAHLYRPSRIDVGERCCPKRSGVLSDTRIDRAAYGFMLDASKDMLPADSIRNGTRVPLAVGASKAGGPCIKKGFASNFSELLSVFASKVTGPCKNQRKGDGGLRRRDGDGGLREKENDGGLREREGDGGLRERTRADL